MEMTPIKNKDLLRKLLRLAKIKRACVKFVRKNFGEVSKSLKEIYVFGHPGERSAGWMGLEKIILDDQIYEVLLIEEEERGISIYRGKVLFRNNGEIEWI